MGHTSQLYGAVSVMQLIIERPSINYVYPRVPNAEFRVAYGAGSISCCIVGSGVCRTPFGKLGIIQVILYDQCHR